MLTRTFRALAYIGTIAVLSFSLTAAFAEEVQPDEKTIEIYREAVQALSSQEIDVAIEKFTQVMEREPAEPYPAFHLTRAYLAKNDTQPAWNSFARAVENGLLSTPDMFLEIETDPALAPIRNAPEYIETVTAKTDFGKAPELVAKDLDGKIVRLSELRGKPVLLVFWSINCPACHVEFDSLKQLKEKLKDTGLVVIGASANPAAAQKENIKKHEYPFTFWRYDPREKMLPLLYTLASSATPASFFIDADGNVVRFYRGYTRAGDFSFAIDLVANANRKE